MDEAEIRALVTRLARPHPSGGAVIERAAILAEGDQSAALMAWVASHGGIAEEAIAAAPTGGLHGSKFSDTRAVPPSAPARYVLPAGALT